MKNKKIKNEKNTLHFERKKDFKKYMSMNKEKFLSSKRCSLTNQWKQGPPLISDKNSSRVFGSTRNTSSIQLVVLLACIF